MNVESFEPLGSNCEFGFVLRDFGNVRPSVFRWTFIGIDGLCELLDNDFRDCFEWSNVRPHSGDMVMETHYQWAFHSALKSGGDGRFTMPEKRLARLFQIERDRVHRDITAFRARLRKGNLVGVFSADGVNDDRVIQLGKAVDRFAGNETNRVVVVSGPRVDGREPGSVLELAPRTLRGTVSALAHYASADRFDTKNWSAILHQLA